MSADSDGMAEVSTDTFKDVIACPSDTLSPFPRNWPEPTTTEEFAPGVFSRAANIHDVATAIGRALRVAGYPEPLYLGYGCEGVAIAANFEAIDRNGRRKAGQDGFPKPADDADTAASAVDFIVGLFYARPGFHRQIVFILADDFGTSSGAIVAQGDLLAIVEPGSEIIPGEYLDVDLTPAHRVRALVYEFELRQGARAAEPIKGMGAPPVGLLAARDHLRAAGVFRKQAR
jgi:hypothetical protein